MSTQAKTKRHRLKIVRLKRPECWIYDHPQGSITAWPIPGGKPLDTPTVNLLLDRAKKKLLE